MVFVFWLILVAFISFYIGRAYGHLSGVRMALQCMQQAVHEALVDNSSELMNNIRRDCGLTEVDKER